MVVGARLAGLSISETAATGIFPYNHLQDYREQKKKSSSVSIYLGKNALLLFTEVRQERPYSFKLDRKATVTQPRYAEAHTGYHSCKLRMGTEAPVCLDSQKLDRRFEKNTTRSDESAVLAII